MIQLSYGTVVDMVSQGGLSHIANEQLYCEAIKKLTSFLSEKRAKMYESCCYVFGQIFQEIRKENLSKVKQYLEDYCFSIIEHVYLLIFRLLGLKVLEIVYFLKWST